MMLAKAFLTSTSFATGFEGGPIFPLLFIGGTMGLVISKILTFIPQGVGVTAGMAGVACAVFPMPLTIVLLLGLLGGQPDLLPVIASALLQVSLYQRLLLLIFPSMAYSQLVAVVNHIHRQAHKFYIVIETVNKN